MRTKIIQWLIIFTSLILGSLLFIFYRYNPSIGILAGAYFILIFTLLFMWFTHLKKTKNHSWFLVTLSCFVAGIVSNMIAVTANGGYMPVSPLIWNRLIDSGFVVKYNYYAYNGSLVFLGDSIPIGYAGFSIGDVIICVGVLLTIMPIILWIKRGEINYGKSKPSNYNRKLWKGS